MKDAIWAYWYAPGCNFGDWLTPYLIKKISGHDANFALLVPDGQYIHFCVGSILSKVTNQSIVWGSGLMFDIIPEIKPHKVLAVRGPLTRKLLLSSGIECPEIYGDPCLLLPRFYKPQIKKKYKFGVIPHFIDNKNFWLEKIKDRDDTIVIDICGKIEDVIDEICSCKAIASSALHGLITADAYGIPSVWIKFSNKVLGSGFKFRDYYASIHEECNTVTEMNGDIDVDALCSTASKKTPDIDLGGLLKACPFKPKTGDDN